MNMVARKPTRMSTSPADGREQGVYRSGDLARFDVREDTIAYAKKWAQVWLGVPFG
ncbi:hypothetical protein [Trinickia sp.]|uniref:hypothetical protein n=1 Tax=Trinickia sp. TaxID=2571163 RepID=UPI003F815F7C